MKLTEKPEAVETSRLLDVNGDVAVFESSSRKNGAVLENAQEVEIGEGPGSDGAQGCFNCHGDIIVYAQCIGLCD